MRQAIISIVIMAAALSAPARAGFASDDFQTGAGALRITFIGHASLLFRLSAPAGPGGTHLYVDPDGRLADFAALPKADVIVVTHSHGDHFDPRAIAALRRPGTEVFVSASCLPRPDGARVMGNGERAESHGVAIEAVPAYNTLHRRPGGQPFHPRGEGNGYVLTFAGLRVYVAGDTEDIPEMAALKNIAVAFLPMNLPYTMTPEMTARAARTIRPSVLYPYHFSDTDPRRLAELLRSEPGIEVRVRELN